MRNPTARTIWTIPMGIPNTLPMRTGAVRASQHDPRRPAGCHPLDGYKTGDGEGCDAAGEEEGLEVLLDPADQERAGEYDGKDGNEAGGREDLYHGLFLEPPLSPVRKTGR